MHFLLYLFFSLFFLEGTVEVQKTDVEIVFESKHLRVEKLTNASYVHTSYLKTDQYGTVECNGLLFVDHNEAIVIDAPTNDSASYDLINWVTQELKSQITAVVAGHYHDDCIGGLKAFHQMEIKSYANKLTIQLAKEHQLESPKIGMRNKWKFSVGQQKVICTFFGEGHSRDNIVAFFPSEQVLFGGCLVKTLGASKGYLGDANIHQWSNTVKKIQQAYPELQIVVPGHGKSGGTELLDYTVKLFEK